MSKRFGVLRSAGSCREPRHFLFAVGAAALAAGVLLILGISAGSKLGDDAAASPNEPSTALEISLECPGWVEDNVPIGVFISGDSFSEQLLFLGSSSRTVQVGVGRYELVPQIPQLMLADGTVLEANEPVSFSFEASDGALNTATILYKVADRSALSDDELAFISEISFVTGDHARQALAQAREKVPS